MNADLMPTIAPLHGPATAGSIGEAMCAARGGNGFKRFLAPRPARSSLNFLQEIFCLCHQRVADTRRHDASHILLTDGGEPVVVCRLTPLDRLNLLQTVFSGLVQEDFPANPSLGADEARFAARPHRREGRRCMPGSAALFCAVMKPALHQGLRFIAFILSLALTGPALAGAAGLAPGGTGPEPMRRAAAGGGPRIPVSAWPSAAAVFSRRAF